MTDAWRAVVAPKVVPWISLLVVFEATVGALILSGGRRTQLGYVGVIGFYLALWLFGGVPAGVGGDHAPADAAAAASRAARYDRSRTGRPPRGQAADWRRLVGGVRAVALGARRRPGRAHHR